MDWYAQKTGAVVDTGNKEGWHIRDGWLAYRSKVAFKVYPNPSSRQTRDYYDLAMRMVRENPSVTQDKAYQLVSGSVDDAYEKIKAFMNNRNRKWTFQGQTLRYDGNIIYTVFGGANQEHMALGRRIENEQPELEASLLSRIRESDGATACQLLQDYFREKDQPKAWRIQGNILEYKFNSVYYIGQTGNSNDRDLANKLVRDQPTLTDDEIRTIVHTMSSVDAYKALARIYDTSGPWSMDAVTLMHRGRTVYNFLGDDEYRDLAKKVVRDQPSINESTRSAMIGATNAAAKRMVFTMMNPITSSALRPAAPAMPAVQAPKKPALKVTIEVDASDVESMSMIYNYMNAIRAQKERKGAAAKFTMTIENNNE